MEMRMPKYRVELSEEEKAPLESILRKGKSSGCKQTRARILLKADEGMRVGEIMKVLNASEDRVYRARRCFVEEGLEAALNDPPRPARSRC